MISTFRRISLRHFAQHKLRTVLTVGGVALGVAAMIGIRLANESSTWSFEETVETIAGRAALEVGNGEVGVPEEILDAVKAIPGVAVAAPSVQGFLPVANLPGERLYVFGVDLLSDSKLRGYESADASIGDPLAFLAQPDSVAVTAEFAERHRLREGDRITLTAPGGPRDLTVRATLSVRSGPATLFGGRLAVMDVFAAERLFGLERRFTAIDVELTAGADLDAVAAAVTREVGGRGIVERPEARGRSFARLISGIRFVRTFAGMLAVAVGFYLILNTMMIAVAERRREIGILRSIGMRRSDVLRLVLLEALALGALGCLFGVPLGIALARAAAASFSANLSDRFIPVEATALALRPAPIVAGAALGLLSALAAAFVAAREALRPKPLEVLRAGALGRERQGSYGRAALVGLAVTGGGLAVWLGRGALPLGPAASGSVTSLGLLVGGSLLAPFVVRGAARRAEASLGRFLGCLAALASRSLVARIGRVALASAAMCVSLGGALVLTADLSSAERTIDAYLDSMFSGVDLFVAATTRVTASDSRPLPASLAREIGELPGVARADAERWVKIPYGGMVTYLAAWDTGLYRRGLRRLDLVEGDLRSALDRVGRGEAAIVSNVFARRFGRRTGDVLSLPSPAGEVRLPIAAVYFDLKDLGMIVVDRALYRRLWRDDTVTVIEPVLEPDADREQVIEAIHRRFGDRYGLWVLTMEELRREVEAVSQASIAAGYPAILIAIAIGLLGIVNSLVASVLDRIREIGILRAVGATRRQVARSIMLEAGIIGLGAAFQAIAVGSVIAPVELDVIAGIVGQTALFRYPTFAAVFMFVATVVLATAAGYLPGRAASRFTITKALEYE